MPLVANMVDLTSFLATIREGEVIANSEFLYRVDITGALAGRAYTITGETYSIITGGTSFNMPAGTTSPVTGSGLNDRFLAIAGTPTENGTYSIMFRYNANYSSTYLGFPDESGVMDDSILIGFTIEPPNPEVDAIVTSYEVNGVDLNMTLAGLSGLTAGPVTGFKVNGADLNTLFAPLANGTAGPVTGFKVNGADLNTLFAGRGTL